MFSKANFSPDVSSSAAESGNRTLALNSRMWSILSVSTNTDGSLGGSSPDAESVLGRCRVMSALGLIKHVQSC